VRLYSCSHSKVRETGLGLWPKLNAGHGRDEQHRLGGINSLWHYIRKP